MRKFLTIILSCGLLLSSCLKETVPTDAVTDDMIDNTGNTIDALLRALPARFNADGSSAYGHYAFGYGSMMHIRDVQTGDMFVAESNYDQFVAWERNVNLGANSRYMQYIWNYYYQSIHACNEIIARVDTTRQCSDKEYAALACALGFRSLYYIDLGRQYEFLPCDVYPEAINGNGNNIAGLTVPIVDENTTEESAQHTPRATKDELFAFILRDLNRAEEYIKYVDEGSDTYNDHSLPHLYTIWGLKARLYIWMADDDTHSDCYQKAFDYASQAVVRANANGHYHMYNYIQSGYYTALAADEQGYATIISSFATNGMFIWGATQTSDNATVQTGVVNWTSWMNPLTTYGYAAAGAYSCIDRRLYEHLSTNDWRRLLYVYNMDGYIDGMTTKFDVANQDFSQPTVSAATTYPIMRIEELDFIAMEAAAHIRPLQGMAQLNAFMQNYCDGNYVYSGERTKEAIIKEIILQKRIELWGEGQSFFDIKRLDIPVERSYEGSGFGSLTRFNTTSRPAWMNWSIVLNEENFNEGVRGYNNPDPSGRYTSIEEI